MVCEEKFRLLNEYTLAASELCDALNNLASLAGMSSGADYRFLSLEKDRAKIRVQRAHLAYQHHLAVHYCGVAKCRTNHLG